MKTRHDLHIIHVNDTEGEPSQVWPRLATAIGDMRTAGRCDLLLHAGDIPLEAPSAPDGVSAMRRLEFDAVALGNHDLVAHEATLRRYLDELHVPLVCANVHGLLPDRIQPYRYLNVKGWKVVVIGVTLGDLPRYVAQQRTAGLTVELPENMLADLIPRLRRNADLLIVLSHCGYATDCALARAVPGIDLIIGGHDHLLLTQPQRIQNTWITQAGADGAAVGIVQISQDNGCLQVSAGHVLTKDLSPDGALLDLLAQQKPDPAELEIVGYTSVNLCLPNVDARSSETWRETPLGNLTADLMRAYAGTDVSLLRCASVINELPAGPIRKRDLARLNWCGDDQIVRLAMTGCELIEVLESGARGGYRLLLTGGARVVYNAARPEGQRVASVQIGETFDPGRLYTVTCSEVLARGVGDYPVLAAKTPEVLPQTIGVLLEAYVRSRKTIQPQLDGRLVIQGCFL